MIRIAYPSDAAVLGGILQDWIEATDWMPKLHTREETVAYVHQQIKDCEVMIFGVTPKGFLVREGELVRSLYLPPLERGYRRGKALLDRAKMGRSRLELWTFQANGGARRFYIREGFVEVEWTDGANNAEKLPDVRLEWRK